MDLHSSKCSRRRHLREPTDGLGIQLIIWGNQAVERFESVAAFCRDCGFTYIEWPGLVLDASSAEIRAASERAALPIRTLHVGYNDIADPERLSNVMQYMSDIGATFLIASGLLGGGTTIQHYRDSGAVFNAVGRRCSDVGMDFYYHTHWWEFWTPPLGGQGIDILLEETCPDLVRFNLDICWAQAAGEDPQQAIRNLADRCNYYHLKDGCFGLHPDSVDWRPLGQGQVNVAGCVQEMLSLPEDRFLVVEQDKACESPETDTLVSREFLRGLGI